MNFAGLLNDVLAHPVTRGAIERTTDARDTALATQEAVLGLLNLPTAAEVERVFQRLRSISQRLELLEDAIDSVGGSISSFASNADQLAVLNKRLEEVLEQLPVKA